MRWLLVSAQHHPSHGGIGTYVSRFVEAATDAGWSVDLITRPGDLHPAKAKIHQLTTLDQDDSFQDRIAGLRKIERIRPYRYALWAKSVAEHLLKMQPNFDAVEFVDCQAEGYAALCSPRVRRRWRGVPMIVHAHTPMFIEEQINGCDPNRFGRAIYHRWERAALENYDGIIVTSRLLAQRMPRGVPCQVIPYPIKSTNAIGPAKPRRDQILFAGSIQPRKGVDVWARSLNGVFHARPEMSAAMVGPDTLNGPGASSMVDHVMGLLAPEFRNRLQWLGARPHHEVLRLMADAALVVVPSVFESFSFVAAEALDLGTPVLVSDQVGLAEHVPDMPQCAAGDADALAHAQLELLANPRTTAEIASRCRERLHAACSPQRHLRDRREFVRSVQAALDCRTPDVLEVDGLDEVESFIDATERAEAAEASALACSNAVS